MLILNKNILTIGGNRLEGGPLTPPEPPGPSDEVTIGTQTWKNANLAIDDGLGGIITNNLGVVNGVDLGTQYYYNWEAANRVANSIPGWHLPSKAEWETLATYVGGSDVAAGKLKSTDGWASGNGTDDYGFTIRPAGYWSDVGGKYYYIGKYAMFWTSTEYSAANAYKINILDTASLGIGNYDKTKVKYTIRLIKDT